MDFHRFSVTAGHATRVRLASTLIWFTPALWAINFIIARKAPGVIGPYTLALGRWGLAAAVLMAVAGTELWQQRKALFAVWYQYIILGFFGMFVCGAWVYLGAQTTGAMNIALIYSAAPALIAVGAVFWLREPFGLRQLLGVMLALAGVVQVIAKGQWLALTQVTWVAGDLWIVAAMVSWALYALLQKRWTSTLSDPARLTAICLGGICTLLPFAWVEMASMEAPVWSWKATELVVSAAVFPGIAAYWIYGWAQKVLGAGRVAVTLYLNPLYAALAAWGVLGEPLGMHHLTGGLLILSGVFLVTSTRTE